jgi:hypothetical protein
LIHQTAGVGSSEKATEQHLLVRKSMCHRHIEEWGSTGHVGGVGEDGDLHWYKLHLAKSVKNLQLTQR